MRHLKLQLTALILVLLLFLGTILVFYVMTLEEEGVQPTQRTDLPVQYQPLTCQFFTRQLFEQNITAQPYTLDGALLAAVVPHYEPMLSRSASMLAAAKEEDYDTVVVIGPNHSGEGPQIIVSGDSWNTPDGLLEGNRELAQLLLANSRIQAAEDRERTEAEWSVSVHMPYLREFFPEAKVVTVLLARGAKTSALQTLAQVLSQQAAEQKVLVLGSVDFSHYQTPDEAERRDVQTQVLIEEGDVEALRRLRGENLDSPETISVILYLKGDRELQLLEHPFETYWENGTERAASYFLYAVTQ